MKKTVYSKKYGVGPVRFTHRANNVVYASGKGEPMIRYLSLHDNAYLRYFKGHEAAVTALEMSPVSDLLVSGAANDTVRLWDLRSAHCHGVLATTGVPLLAFDPRGLVFALALDSKHIRLFDVHSYDRGPFAAFEIVDPARAGARWTAIRFSPDGRELLVATAAGAIYLIDSFDGYVKQVLTGNQNSAHLDLQPAFTPDAQFVLCGSQDGRVHAWSRATGRQVAALEGHAAAPRVLAFNPKHAMLASACTSLVRRQQAPRLTRRRSGSPSNRCANANVA